MPAVLEGSPSVLNDTPCFLKFARALGRNSAGQLGANRFDNLAARWKNPERCKRAAVNGGFAVDENLELSIATADHLDVRAELPAQFGRHPDGVKPRHSIRAEPNYHSCHDSPPAGFRCA